jgi:hypothetical protein
VVEYVAADPAIQATGKNKDDVAAALAGVGFDEEMMAKPITGISGGWKMKLALTRCVPGFVREGGGRGRMVGEAASVPKGYEVKSSPPTP